MKDELVDIMMNIHKFNQDLTNLNIKYCEEIEEQKEEIKQLKLVIKEIKEYGTNCLNNMKELEEYKCDNIEVNHLLKMCHENYLDMIKEVKIDE